MQKNGKIIDLHGSTYQQNRDDGPDSLKPGTVIVHCVLEPDSGRVQMHRSERNPPPKNANDYKVEVDNWFTLLTNCVAQLIAHCIGMGISRQLMIDTMNRVVNTYLDSGGTGGHTKKIVVSSTEKEAKVIEKNPTAGNYDKEIIDCGFNLLSSETYNEYCSRVGLADRDKNLIPVAAEFYNHLVFRKPISDGVFLEIAREKNPLSVDDGVSIYLCCLVLSDSQIQKKFFWQITDPQNTKELVGKIYHEASTITACMQTVQKLLN